MLKWLTLVYGLTSTFPALACMHFKPNYQVIEGTKHAFLFHDGERAHLVINTDLKTDQQSLPDRLAWVLPFPSLPEKYEEADPALFTELGNLVYPATKGGLGSNGVLRGGNSRAAPAIRVHAKQFVGRYEIHPIEILSDEDQGKALNDWLASHEFIPMPSELQSPYLKKGAVFLAVSMSLKGLKKADLKPLHVTYRSENLEFPLRFTHDTRTFDLDLFVYTPWNLHTPWEGRRSEIPEMYLQEVAMITYKPETLDRKSTRVLRKLLGNQIGYLYRFVGRGLNGPDKRLKDLKKDPFIVPQ